MKLLSLTIAFVTAVWLIAVSVYSIYECTMIEKGYRPVSTFEFRDGLVSALNYALPAGVLCLLFIIKTNKTDPIATEVFLLCMVTCVLGAYLAFRAKDNAFPDPSDPTFAKAIWWIPDPEAEADPFVDLNIPD